jgi:hypothetical protein
MNRLEGLFFKCTVWHTICQQKDAFASRLKVKKKLDSQARFVLFSVFEKKF